MHLLCIFLTSLLETFYSVMLMIFCDGWTFQHLFAFIFFWSMLAVFKAF